ncbi:MAG: hypothetical protein HC831_17595 [Chloroflexia bacterium]|nr:hypothetical protein [Chloroflexia bacterium]
MRRYSAALLFLIVSIASCSDLKLDKGETSVDEKIIPQNFGISIPSALNSNFDVGKKRVLAVVKFTVIFAIMLGWLIK